MSGRPKLTWQEQALLNEQLLSLVNSKRPSVEGVQALIGRGANVNAADAYKQTALISAALLGHTDIARLLLSEGADVKAKKWNEGTSLHCAAIYGHTDIARLLLNAGADVKEKNNDGDTPLHSSARNGHTDIARLLLTAGADIDAVNLQGYTPLHCAACYGDKDITTTALLLTKGANPDAEDNDGHTPLYYAVVRGHEETESIMAPHNIGLLKIEAGQALTDKEASNPALVFLHAVGTGNVPLLQDVLISPNLVKGDAGYVDPASPDYRAEYAEHYSKQKGSENIAKIIAHKFTFERTALHVLAEHPIAEVPGQYQVHHILSILVAAGIDPNKKDANGETPFIKAVNTSNVDVLEQLIILGANPSDTFMHKGKLITPLEYLVETGNTNSFEILVNILEDNHKLKEAVKSLGDKLIEFARENGLVCFVKLTEIKAEIDSDAEGAFGEGCTADASSTHQAHVTTGGAASTDYPFGYDEDDPMGPVGLAGVMTDASTSTTDLA